MRPAFELLLALSENNVLGTGPNGESPTPPIGFGLTNEELRKVRAMHARAAIVMHYGANDWSQAQVAGLQAQFAEMGIDVIAVTDAGFDPRKQVADLETVLASEPDIIVSIPTDPVATAAAYKKAAAQGVKLVFMDNVPMGMKHGEDYVSVASADNFGNGVASAHLMAEALDRRGTVGLVFHDADFFVTRRLVAWFIGGDHDDAGLSGRRDLLGPGDGVQRGRRAVGADHDAVVDRDLALSAERHDR